MAVSTEGVLGAVRAPRGLGAERVKNCQNGSAASAGSSVDEKLSHLLPCMAPACCSLSLWGGPGKRFCYRRGRCHRDGDCIVLPRGRREGEALGRRRGLRFRGGAGSLFVWRRFALQRMEFGMFFLGGGLGWRAWPASHSGHGGQAHRARLSSCPQTPVAEREGSWRV